ncbi:MULTISPECIES: DUF429 domain-containing protein [Haloferax]|uniref:DUF429 domain-containing protein n=2 Tax=Haloferax TaxID=2251 RepID=A0A6G1Z3W1_9EURY|nr:MULTISPECIES: DUF429 domain-containing protein [Haloferax]KAB1188540.1 DUF429 domain-containing protein [Haloferax sp. CBA1149]MRW81236.1 DUF429 domain-containing protein [Haloferax marinisediminis]
MAGSRTVVGVDGCRAGWVCAVRSADGLSVRIEPDFESVWERARTADVVVVDIPIGLPTDDRRQCDYEARRRLGARASTVFFAPVRSVLDAPSHECASERNRDSTGFGLSIQAWNLVPKIRAVDSVLQSDSLARRQVREAHPELAFAAFAGEPLTESKSTPEGRQRRLDVLRTAFPDDDVASVYHETLAETLRRDVARDDILDALILAAAARHPLDTLPESPPRDATGLQMAIHVPRVQSDGRKLS